MPEKVFYLDDRVVVDSTYYELKDCFDFYVGGEDVEGAKRVYMENSLFKAVGIHTSTKGFLEFAKLLRRRDKDVIMFIVTTLKDEMRSDLPKILKDFEIDYDEIVSKNNWREELDQILTTLTRRLNNG